MATDAAASRAGPKGPGLAVLASNEAGLLLITVGFVALFSWLTPGFTSPFNVYALTRVLSIDVVIGFSMQSFALTSF